MLKYLSIAFGVTAVVAAGIVVARQSQSPPLRTAPHSGPSPIFAAGRIEGASEEIRLRPQLEGRIVTIAVSEGQVVNQGDLLLLLDDSQYRHGLSSAEAEVRQCQGELARLVNGASKEERQEAEALHRASLADLERAQLAWGRVRRLTEERASSQQESDNQRTLVSALQARVDAAKANVDSLDAPAREDEVEMAKAKIAAAKAKLELANVHLDRTRLLAPAAGKILQLNVREAELASNESVEPPIVFADTSRFRVRAFVEELDARRVKVGMLALVSTDGEPDEQWRGHVTKLSPRMGRKQLFTDDPAEQFDVKTREVWIDLDTTDDLIIGLRVDVSIDPTSAPQYAEGTAY
ncbi:MAG: HlyD family secretion protein [Pirellulaceae bacterium]